jgi:hypothetical protein
MTDWVKRNQYERPSAEVLRERRMRQSSARRAALLPRVRTTVEDKPSHPQLAIRRRTMAEARKANSQARQSPMPDSLRGYMHWTRKRGRPHFSGSVRRHRPPIEFAGDLSAVSPREVKRRGFEGARAQAERSYPVPTQRDSGGRLA